MKPLYSKEAPPHVKQACEQARRDTLDSGTTHCQAVGTWNFLHAAVARGYYIPRAEVPTPALDRIAAFQGNQVERSQLRVLLSLETSWENRCLRYADSLVAWSQQPSAQDEAAVKRVEIDKAKQERETETKITAAVQAAEAERLAKLRATARKQIEK